MSSRRVCVARVVCEIGCGPGQISRYLKDQGVNMSASISPRDDRLRSRLNRTFPRAGQHARIDLPDGHSRDRLLHAIIHLRRDEHASVEEMMSA